MITPSYMELYEKSGINLPHEYLVWGLERFISGSPEYMVDAPDGGKVNACFLPETDTIRDIEEEVLDAVFNLMVLRWKYKQKGGNIPDSLYALIISMNETVKEVHRMRMLNG